MGKKSRNKGAAYERYVASLFRDAGFDYAERHLEYQSNAAIAGRDLSGTEPFAVQCKHYAKTPSITAIEEINSDSEYRIPVAFLKRSRGGGMSSLEVAVIETDTFMKILKLIVDNDLIGALLDECDA